jgi:hypothetical protein
VFSVVQIVIEYYSIKDYAKALVVYCFIFVSLHLCLGEIPHESFHAIFCLGANLRFTDEFKIFSLDIPFFDVSIINTDYIQLTTGGLFMWGLSDFFVDVLSGIGVQVYPFKDIFNLHGRVYVGTFLLNNISLMAEAGIAIDIPFADLLYVYLGCDIFAKGSWPVLGFIKNDAWYLSTNGFCFGCGLKGKF